MLGRDWKDGLVYMMDFEGSPASGVVEYGIVCLGGGEICETASEICSPEGMITARDSAVHGITESVAARGDSFSRRYSRFVEWRRKGIFAAHNRHAENTFLKSTWALPAAVPDWRGGTGTAQEWGPWIDTLSLYRTLYPGMDSYSLGLLVEMFAITGNLERLADQYCPEGRKRAHCALYDALASALLLLRLEDEATLRGKITFGWLLQLSTGMDFQKELF